MDVSSGTIVKRFYKHKNEVHILTSNPVNDSIAMSAGYDGLVVIWDMIHDKILFQHESNSRFLDGTFSLDGNFFALVDDTGNLHIFGLLCYLNSYNLYGGCKIIDNEKEFYQDSFEQVFGNSSFLESFYFEYPLKNNL